MAVPADADADVAQGRWSGDGGAWSLHISGDWRGAGASLPSPPEAVQGSLTVDASGLTSWDTRLASTLWHRLSLIDPARVNVELHNLPPGLQQIVLMGLPRLAATTGATAATAAHGAVPAAPAPVPKRRRPGWVTALGQRATAAIADGRDVLTFFGEVLLSLGRLLSGRSGMRWSDLAWQIEQTGPRSLPIVAIVSLLVALILAYMGAAQLELFGAQSFIANLVTVAVVRETAALVTGIVLSGRVGAAFAAQIGSMRANEEVDALQTLGIDPIDHLVLPRVLALLIVAPLLTAFGAMVGMGVGWLVAVGIYGVTPLEYANKSLQALTMPHVLIGLLKGTVYGVLVALAGCRQGLAAGRSAQAVGEATTAAVVQSIVWIVVAASLLTVVFQRLDW